MSQNTTGKRQYKGKEKYIAGKIKGRKPKDITNKKPKPPTKGMKAKTKKPPYMKGRTPK